VAVAHTKAPCAHTNDPPGTRDTLTSLIQVSANFDPDILKFFICSTLLYPMNILLVSFFNSQVQVCFQGPGSEEI
jgi:hypothetical protein